MLEEISRSFDISSSIIFHNFRENCRDSEYSQWRHKKCQRKFRNFPTHLYEIFRKICLIFLTQILHVFCRNGRFVSPPKKLWKNYRKFSRKFLVETGPNNNYTSIFNRGGFVLLCTSHNNNNTSIFCRGGVLEGIFKSPQHWP